MGRLRGRPGVEGSSSRSRPVPLVEKSNDSSVINFATMPEQELIPYAISQCTKSGVTDDDSFMDQRELRSLYRILVSRNLLTPVLEGLTSQKSVVTVIEGPVAKRPPSIPAPANFPAGPYVREFIVAINADATMDTATQLSKMKPFYFAELKKLIEHYGGLEATDHAVTKILSTAQTKRQNGVGLEPIEVHVLALSILKDKINDAERRLPIERNLAALKRPPPVLESSFIPVVAAPPSSTPSPGIPPPESLTAAIPLVNRKSSVPTIFNRFILSPTTWTVAAVGLFTGAVIYTNGFADLAQFFSNIFTKFPAFAIQVRKVWEETFHLPKIDSVSGSAILYYGLTGLGFVGHGVKSLIVRIRANSSETTENEVL